MPTIVFVSPNGGAGKTTAALILASELARGAAVTVIGRFIASLALASMLGCTHTALRDDTLQMGGTLTELQYRIVLENLAMLTESPATIPWHVKFDEGTMQVSNKGRGDLNLSPLAADLAPLIDFRVGRTITGQWRMVPVTDPKELRDLQVAYQKAMGKQIEDEVLKELEKTEEIPSGWFQSGRRGDVPANASYVGRYLNTYVWVAPDDVESLSKFTLSVLTIVKFKQGERSFGGGLVPTPD